MDNPDSVNDLTADVSIPAPPEGGWIAARAYSRERLPIQMWPTLTPQGSPVFAHTSPIYLLKNGALPHDAEAVNDLLEINAANRFWLAEIGKFRTESERQELLSINQEANDILQTLLDSEE